MACNEPNKFGAKIYPGEPFTFYVHLELGGSLADFSKYEFKLSMKEYLCSDKDIYLMTSQSHPDSFTPVNYKLDEDDEGVKGSKHFDKIKGKTLNLRVTIPSDITKEMYACRIECVYLGLVAKHKVRGDTIQIVNCAQLDVSKVTTVY